MVKIKQDLLNSIKEFTLMDDPFMTKVFEDDIERTQLIGTVNSFAQISSDILAEV